MLRARRRASHQRRRVFDRANDLQRASAKGPMAFTSPAEICNPGAVKAQRDGRGGACRSPVKLAAFSTSNQRASSLSATGL
jgi:hypothetical protein